MWIWVRFFASRGSDTEPWLLDELMNWIVDIAVCFTLLNSTILRNPHPLE